MKILGEIRRQNKTTGFTIAEVVIATMIFTLAMAGVFATISQLRQPAVASSQQVTAAFIGKKILDDLRSEVSATTWNSGLLTPGNTYMNQVTVGTITYNATYTVQNDPNGTNARQVTLNVTW